MSALFQGAVVAAFFFAANVVAAGVVLVLGKMLQAIAPAWHSPWPWILICAAGALAAFLFLRGAMLYAAERSRTTTRRINAAKPDPLKGLQSAAGRRGG